LLRENGWGCPRGDEIESKNQYHHAFNNFFCGWLAILSSRRAVSSALLLLLDE
jgi:hypothetical protein